VADTPREALVAALLLVELATRVVIAVAHLAAMVLPPQHHRQPKLLLRPKPHPRLTKMDGRQSQFPAKVVAVAAQ
jgi:hypothetical protein